MTDKPTKLTEEDEEFLEAISDLEEDKKNIVIGYLKNKIKEIKDQPKERKAGITILSVEPVTDEMIKKEILKQQDFPIVFEDNAYQIEIRRNIINIIQKNTEEIFSFNKDMSLPLLIKAINKYKELKS